MTIHHLWAEAVRHYGALPALGWADGAPWTYRQVDDRVQGWKAQLRESGRRPGDRVVLWAANQPGWGVAYLGVTTSSLIVVPLLPDSCAYDTANVLVHSGAALMIVGRSLLEPWNRWFALAPEPLRRSLATLEVWVLEDLMDLSPPTVPFEAQGDDNDLAAILYTSGTTGSPKGVMLTHGNITSNVLAAAPIVGFVPGDRILSVLPLAHTYECTLGFLIPLSEGIHIGYLSKPPSPTALLPILASFRPHAMLSVPLVMEKIYRSKVKPLWDAGVVRWLRKIPGFGWLLAHVIGAKLKRSFGGRLKFFGIGGAALLPEVAHFLHQSGFPYAIGYGLTETSPLIAGHKKGHLYSTGRVLTGVQVKIDEPRNAGAGEILVRGPNVMVGYYHDPEQTALAFTPDGWFRTGDLGSFDTGGHLTIRGRSKNLILGPSGENIYPEAIEALLNQDHLVVESLVLQRGAEIVAKVVVEGNHPAEAVEAHLRTLKQKINDQLARFSRLSFVEVQPVPFEKTATLKIKRYLYA